MQAVKAMPDTDPEVLYRFLLERLGDVAPAFELRRKAEIAAEINRLKRDRGAVILGHNYMEPALFHTIPDFTGDSLDLCRRAARTEGDPIVFCGVRFMAETAKILNPSRTVLLPARKAGCSLAESITAEDVRRLRLANPGVPVAVYVNTYAEVKAEADVCVTSSNAARIVEALGAERVIFLPDEFLARNVARETGRQIAFPGADGRIEGPTPRGPFLIGWRGRCEVHERFSVGDVEAARRQFPDVYVLAHPECSPEVVAVADFSGGTKAMIERVEVTSDRRFLLLTECSMGDNIAAANPNKQMLGLCSIRCPHMNEITLEETLDALRTNRQVIEIPEEIRVRAARSVERMLELS